jgi:S-adenosylmethionine:tRNA ribosyltransferase-isomerase
VRFTTPGGDPERAIELRGEIPLPPYITRAPEPEDSERYQTVYARSPGAVAAPTAGLHFDPGILDGLRSAGICSASLTLHVGPGTFEPLRHDEIGSNVLEAERFVYPASCADAVLAARAGGRRIVAVGTTSARVLETVGPDSGPVEGSTSLFIHPPYVFRGVDSLLTNFHLPGSSLLCLVAAFAGIDLMKKAYECAITGKYRFYSYGDAMLIL